MDKVHTKNKAFTYAENKLLDQITLEITEAWQKDIDALRKHYRTIEKTVTSTKNVVDFLDLKLPVLAKFIESNEFIQDFKSMSMKWDAINARLGEIDKYLFELDKKINYDYVTSFTKSVKALEDTVKDHLLKKAKKPWWKIF